MTNIGYIAFYGATLSTVLALTGLGNFIYKHYKKKQERKKFKTDLYYLTKINSTTKEEHPVIVILMANLGSERICIKSIEYSGTSKNGCETSGSPGWYEQPEEAYGIRNRLLPVVLESGQTKDLPMFSISVFKHTENLKIKLIGFDDETYFIEQCDIDKIYKEIERFKK